MLFTDEYRFRGALEGRAIMRNTILIVDDMDLNREMLAEILRTEYDIEEAENGIKALEVIRQKKDELAAILLDLVMPEMDGFQVLEVLNQEKLIGIIPVLVISGENTVETEQRCFSLGISDFLGKPFNSALVKKRVKNAADIYVYKNQLEEKVQEQTAVLRKSYRVLQQQAEKLQKRNEEIIDILGTVVEYRSLESGEHIQRVKGYTRILGECFMKEYPEYGLSQEQVDIIISASALHDIGKIAIPDSILLKPGRLTADEFEYMKSHTTRGCEILDSISGAWDKKYGEVSYEICRHHHERYDGRGYPDGLAGDEIPVSAQLVSVADVYDALVNERCYKDAFTCEEAFHMIVNGECGVFSPKLMEVFRKTRDEFEAFTKRK